MADIIFETNRLALRRWRLEDRAPFAAMNADPEVMRFFLTELSRSESDALVDRIEAHFEKHGFGLFALERKADAAFLGFTGFLHAPHGTPVEGEVEIGWRLARAYWREGFAFEAAKACLDWLWQNTEVSRVVSFTSDDNRPSQLLMQKLGLERRQDLDFYHPAIPRENPLCHQVVFGIDRRGGADG